MTIGLVPALGEEQQMLLDASIRFMDDHHPLAVVRDRADHPRGLEPEYRRAAAELGWFGLLADEALGGGAASGNGLLDAAVIAAERGARVQPGPFVGHSVVVAAMSGAIAAGDAPSEAAGVAADLISGGAWATWAFAERPTVEVGNDGRLTGRVDAVAEASECAWFLVTAAGPSGPVQLLVAADTPGVEVTAVDGLDVTRRWSTLELQGAEGMPVGSPGPSTDRALAGQARHAAVLAAAETAGTMSADFDLALQYAKDRIAFGRPIGSFQAIKHILADTSLALEMSLATVAAAATSLGSGAPDGPTLAHAAKAFVGEVAPDLAHNCFQVFGGIGYTWEHDQHLYFRRIAADIATFGTAEWHRSRLLDEALTTGGQ